MMDLLKVAIRNVGRNGRRSLITALTVFLGVVVTTGSKGLLNGLQGEIRSGLTRKLHGDLQIHQKGYADSLEANPYKILISGTGQLSGTLLATPQIEAVSPRLRVMGLVNHQRSQTTVPVLITGIDSKRELDVCPRIRDSVLEGGFIDSAREPRTRAAADEQLEDAPGLDGWEQAAAQSAPKAAGHHQILLTPTLMRGMEAAIGDEVVVLMEDPSHMQQALVARIAGVADPAIPGAAARMAWMDLSALQSALGLHDKVSEIAIRTAPKADVDAVRARLGASLDQGLVAETWLELAGLLRDAMSIQNAVFSVVILIMFTIVISAIVNTSLMTVMERVSEIGTLMALGYRRRHILLLFLTESAVIGFGGGVAGIAAVSVPLTILGSSGIRMALPGQSVPTLLYPEVTYGYLAATLAVATLAALAASIYPAYRASRLKPVEALAHH